MEVQKILDEAFNPKEEGRTEVPRFHEDGTTKKQLPVPIHSYYNDGLWVSATLPILLRPEGSPSQRKLEDFGVSCDNVSFICPIPPKTVLMYYADQLASDGPIIKFSAEMIYLHSENLTCQGFGPGTIVIKYIVRANPPHYHSFQRLAFLPDNTQGNSLLEKLKQAFLKGCTLFVNKDGQVDWRIPHKTILASFQSEDTASCSPEALASAFPDPSYLDQATLVLDSLLIDADRNSSVFDAKKFN